MKNIKNVIVTGGTKGIGRAISEKMAEDGHQVYALYARDRSSADELSKLAQEKNWKLECLRGDLTHPEKYQVLLEQLKQKCATVDILVHSAASGVHKMSSELTTKQMAWTFEINVFAIHQLVKDLVERMPRGSRLIGLTSSGAQRVIPYYAAVGSSKGALESLFRHYALEFAPRGIAVNCVCPGLVLTDAIEAFPDKEARNQKTLDLTPSGRLTTPADVAGVVQFLCSPAADQIIGQTLVLDGGKTLSS